MKMKNYAIAGITVGVIMSSPMLAQANEKESLYVGGVPEGQKLNVRNIDLYDDVIDTLSNGDKVSKIEDLSWKKGWSLVITPSGKKGICASRYLTNNNLPSEAELNTMYTTSKVNVRTGAGTYYRVYKEVPMNTKVEFVSEKGEWSKVKFEGRILFINSQYLSKSKTETETTQPQINAQVDANTQELQESEVYRYGASVTTSQSSAQSIENVRVAFNKLNGTVVNPGETFSYLNSIGDINTANGYVESTILVGGKKSTGVGGGVCLGSTVVFNAMLDAGIEPMSRRNHSLPSAYVQRGMDAMVTTGGSDLKFKNNTGVPILIKASVSDGYATVTFETKKDITQGHKFSARVESLGDGVSYKTYLQKSKDGEVVGEKLVASSRYLK